MIYNRKEVKINMKNFDVKKLLVLIVIIAVVILGIFLISKGISSKVKSKENELKTYESYVLDYYVNLTAGANTLYSGYDLIYGQDKITIKSLDQQAMINTAASYVSLSENKTDINYSEIVNAYIDKYPNIKEANLVSIDDLKVAMEELFGITNFAPVNIEHTFLYPITYTYLDKHNVYMIEYKTENLVSDNLHTMEYSLVETKKEKDKIITRVAVAYVLKDNTEATSYTYTKDRNNENIIVEKVEEFPKDKINEFDQFDFTLVKNDKGKYILESIEKVK